MEGHHGVWTLSLHQPPREASRVVFTATVLSLAKGGGRPRNDGVNVVPHKLTVRETPVNARPLVCVAGSCN